MKIYFKNYSLRFKGISRKNSITDNKFFLEKYRKNADVDFFFIISVVQKVIAA